MGSDAMILVFWMLGFKPTFSLSSFTFIKRLFSSSLLSATRVVLSVYLRLLIFLPAILIPACASSSPAFLMMYSVFKLNKQDDNIQPWHTPLPIWQIVTGGGHPPVCLKDAVRLCRGRQLPHVIEWSTQVTVSGLRANAWMHWREASLHLTEMNRLSANASRNLDRPHITPKQYLLSPTES